MPQNGTEFGPGPSRGRSSVLFRNNGSQNIVGKISSLASSDGRGDDRLIFIRPFKSATLQQVQSGRYLIRFCEGTQWNATAATWFFDPMCQQFEDTADLRTTKDEKAVHWHNVELTIEPVMGGTAKTKPITPDQF